MSQYLLINRIRVQNANAIAGFTWGFPSITHFMGFAHNLSRKLSESGFSGFELSGCGVVAHDHHVHTYSGSRFTQSKNPAYFMADVDKVLKGKTPSIIEEGKMNMMVSLLIGFDGFLGNQADSFIEWVKKQCLLQRLAGGTILTIEKIHIFDIEEKNKFFLLKRKLLPGFALMDRAGDLAQHYESNLRENSEAELLDAWLDFAALKQRARPKSDLITKHLLTQIKNETLSVNVLEAWSAHLDKVPYELDAPPAVTEYFATLNRNDANQALLKQWQHYLYPTAKTPADWEYLPKPSAGYLVPIMTGYKAISQIYDNRDIANTRDSKTPVCFVEATHSVGEWRGVNNFRTAEDIASCLWHYEYQEHWYLCKQRSSEASSQNAIAEDSVTIETPDLN